MAHLETWNPSDRQWELHSLSTSRHVSEDQRLLYKVILDSTSSISNDSCPGLAAKLALQPRVGKWTRTGEEYILPVPPTPPLLTPVLSTPILSTPVSTPTATPAGSWSARSPSSSAHSPSPPSTKSLKRKRLSRQAGGLKKACWTKGKEVVRSRVWPTQYHVSEVTEGLEYIQNGRHQGRGTIKEIYQEFYGQPMVHSTFKSNRNLWNEQISPELKSHFIAYGKTPLGLWPQFLHTYHHDGVELPMHQDEESDSAASDKNDHDHPRDENTDTEGSGGNGRGHRHPSLEWPSPTASDCVFCGLPLPDVLSPQLHSLLEELLRPSNSYILASNDGMISRHHHPGCGWKLRVEFCGRHVCETQVASDADGESWPSPIDIDYTLLDSRVRSLQPELAHLPPWNDKIPQPRWSLKVHGLGAWRLGIININMTLLSLFPDRPLERTAVAPVGGPTALDRATMSPDAIYLNPQSFQPLTHMEFFTDDLHSDLDYEVEDAPTEVNLDWDGNPLESLVID
ncbi:hypothetical protein JB92DRAFT_3108026 [Gautieria morchelliformis]|nr:hypothetical protein JB92DRAFT_3108026 [Gautieria morchelliformis]